MSCSFFAVILYTHRCKVHNGVRDASRGSQSLV